VTEPGGRSRKTGLTGGALTSAVRTSLAGSLEPSLPHKNEFGIGGDAISRCLEELEFETFSTVESPPTPLTLTISVQIWTNYETHIFKKWGGTYPQTPPWPRQWLQLRLTRTTARRMTSAVACYPEVICHPAGTADATIPNVQPLT